MPALLLLAGCHPPSASVPPEQRLRQAWSHLRLEEFDEAEAGFRTVLKALPHDAESLRLNATYGLAMVLSLTQPGEQFEAHALFNQLIEQDHSPNGDLAAWAALALVRERALATPDDPKLLTAYADLLIKYPATAAAEEAFIDQTTMLVQSLRPEDARKALANLQSYLAAHPQSPNRATFHALSSSASQTLHDYPAALQAAIDSVNAREIDPANPHQNNILEFYRIGLMAQFDVGDFATARAYYEKFLAEYPRDQRAFNVRLLLNHLDETETRLRAGLPPRQLSTIATGIDSPRPKPERSETGDGGGGTR